MPYTNFIGAGVSVNGAPLIPGGGTIPLSNNYIFVSNLTGDNGSDGNPGTMDLPFATLNAAITYAGNTGLFPTGSAPVIVCLQGHSETITANTALLFNVADITIVGLGVGSNRPKFTFTTANTNCIPVSAANIKISGCVFVGNFLSIATLFSVAAAPGFTVDSCEFRDTDATHGFLSIITTTITVNADGLTYTNNLRVSAATTTPGPDIVIAGTIARVTVKGNTSYHSTISNNVAALIDHGALVVSGLDCGYNNIYSVNTDTSGGAILVNTSAITGYGMIYNNYVRALDTAAALLITAAAVQYGLFNNYYTGDVGLSGFLLPAAATDS